MRRGLAIAAALVGVLPLASCRGHGGSPADYTLTVHGRATVTGAHAATYTDGHHQLAVGDTVRISDGSATLALPGKASLELRAGRSDSVVRVASEPTVVDGDALAIAGSSGVGLRAGAAAIHLANGAARVRRSAGVTLAVYEGVARVEALGQRLETPALRQAAVSDTGALPVHAVPLVYDRSHPDPWDVRYLGDAIDLGSQLDRRSKALTAELATASSDAAFLAKVVPPLRDQHAFGPALVDQTRSVGETVVGASIALGGDGDFVKRWTSAFGFRQEGADWGLVAADQQARRSAVFGVLDGVLDNAAPSSLVASGSTSTTRPAPSTTSTTGTSTRTSSTTTTPPPPSSVVTVPPLTIPPLVGPSSPPTSPPTTVVPRLPDPLPQIIGPLLGGLERPTDGDDSAVPSEDGRRTHRGRGDRTQAVLNSVPGLRPARGPGLSRSGRGIARFAP